MLLPTTNSLPHLNWLVFINISSLVFLFATLINSFWQSRFHRTLHPWKIFLLVWGMTTFSGTAAIYLKSNTLCGISQSAFYILFSFYIFNFDQHLISNLPPAFSLIAKCCKVFSNEGNHFTFLSCILLTHKQ